MLPNVSIKIFTEFERRIRKQDGEQGKEIRIYRI